MSNRYWTGLLALFVGLDLAFSFWRNYQLPLDGDLAATVLPAPWHAQVLHDPFGWSVLTQHAVYSGPNRFFAHAAMGLYWKTAPRLLQVVLTPISSLYAANALFTTCTQAGLLLLLAWYIRLGSGTRHAHLWTLAALLTPLFQTAGGYYEQMGITDRANTYTFFYAFAMVPVLLLALPFYRAAQQQQPLQLAWWQVVLMLGLMVIAAFNGPIAGATVAVGLLLLSGHWAWNRLRSWRGLPTPGARWYSTQALLLLSVLAALCLYSFYIGRNNVENTHTYTLRQLYALLPAGAVNYFVFQSGLPVLTLLIGANLLLACWATPAAAARRRQLTTLGWVGAFIVAYLLLLPLGGYRSYRPNLLRNDTALPMLLSLVFAYGYSAYYLLSTLPRQWRGGYLLGVCLVGVFYLYADGQPDDLPTNDCERWGLDQLSRARTPVVQVANFCPVLAWSPITEPQQSEIQAQMLYYWHVTPAKTLYYQK